MFESAEIGHAIDKKTFEAEEPVLREALLAAQYRLREQAGFPVIILINGVEGAGKGETVKLLTEWMDPRLIQVSTFDHQTDEELARPPAWRYWRQLPAKGRMGIFFGNWYSQMLQARVDGRIKDAELDRYIEQALNLERMLCDEGALILKFWFHLSQARMEKRLRQLKDDPLHSWRLSPLDWRQASTYERFVRFGDRVLRRTSREEARWHVIEGSDHRYRSLTAGRILLQALESALARPPRPARAVVVPGRRDDRHLLESLDLSQKLRKADYQAQLITEQARLSGLLRDKRYARHALVAAFEGHDAAGKGGAIRRVAAALDPRQYRIVPIAAPTDEERAQPYLWRFWRHIPARRHFTLFDRSWYGRVLVERVEQLCSPADWQRAYGEINDFEEQLVDAGVVLVKFWLSIDRQTQLERFQERESIAFKRFKITAEDWRNREKWDDYRDAIEEMVERTSTAIAPWTLVEANDKRFARIKVLRTLNEALEAAFARD